MEWLYHVSSPIDPAAASQVAQVDQDHEAIEMPTAHHWYREPSRIVTSWSSNVGHPPHQGQPAGDADRQQPGESAGRAVDAATRRRCSTGEERDDRPLGLGEAAVEPGEASEVTPRYLVNQQASCR